VWSANLAYCVGLITSDGCLQKDGRHIDLTSTGLEVLEKFCIGIGREIHIGQKRSSNGGLAYRVQFSDVALYDFLLEAGLTPAKSLTMRSLRIPSKFYPDFLRGLFDGDGTTYGYRDSRWPNSFMYYVAITSASRPFLEHIADMNRRHIGTSGMSIKHGVRAYSLCYAKHDSAKIASYMYYSRDVLALERKRRKLQGFISACSPGII